MKIVGKILVVLAMCMAGSASAQTGADTVCTPYKMPIESTITSCGPGLIGSKFKTTTKVCPSGAVTESNDYDTSGCVAAPTPAGSVNTTSRCALMPDSCAIAPVAQNCPTGSHWSLLGSGIAHCVQDDPVCPWGTSLKHDTMGNPSCEQNTCPANQVLQSDGISCACPSGTAWTGSTCSAPTCSSSSSYTTGSCPSGQTGTVYYYTNVSCPSGAYGSPSYSSSTDSSGCTAAAPACGPYFYVDSRPCISGTGTEYRTVDSYCPYGASGPSAANYGAWDSSQCVVATPPPAPAGPTCTEYYDSTPMACGSGFTGTKYQIDYHNCPNGNISTWYNEDGCGCANGGTNYPTCSPPYTPSPAPIVPPPPPGCDDQYGTQPIGKIDTACDGPGNGPGPFPRGQTYKCTAYGWAILNPGSSIYMESCR